MMNRTQKEAYVEDLRGRLTSAPFLALADYRGVDVAEINHFRRTLAAKGIEYEVIKNTLVRRALAGTEYEAVVANLVGMTGWVISGEDPIDAAKTLKLVFKELDFEKKEKFGLKGGYFDGKVLEGVDVIKVADLPSKEELLVMLLRTIQEGPRQMVSVVQAPARDLVNLLKNYENKLAEAE
jgi:large subunit ribosomal protein L10